MNQKHLDEQRRGGGKEGRRERGQGWALNKDQAGEEEVRRKEQMEIVTKIDWLATGNICMQQPPSAALGKGTVQITILWGEMY